MWNIVYVPWLFSHRRKLETKGVDEMMNQSLSFIADMLEESGINHIGSLERNKFVAQLREDAEVIGRDVVPVKHWLDVFDYIVQYMGKDNSKTAKERVSQLCDIIFTFSAMSAHGKIYIPDADDRSFLLSLYLICTSMDDLAEHYAKSNKPNIRARADMAFKQRRIIEQYIEEVDQPWNYDYFDDDENP